jgi:DNA-binding response OmpR family regulator
MAAFDVLIFDDNEVVAEALGSMLTSFSQAEVQVASRVDDALARLADDNVDFALIDYWAPEGGGAKVAAAAVERDVPFSFITGDPLAADTMQALGVPVLRKPCGIAELVARATAAVQRSRAQRAKAGALMAEAEERSRRLRELQIRLCRRMGELDWRL